MAKRYSRQSAIRRGTRRRHADGLSKQNIIGLVKFDEIKSQCLARYVNHFTIWHYLIEVQLA